MFQGQSPPCVCVNRLKYDFHTLDWTSHIIWYLCQSRQQKTMLYQGMNSTVYSPDPLNIRLDSGRSHTLASPFTPLTNSGPAGWGTNKKMGGKFKWMKAVTCRGSTGKLETYLKCHETQCGKWKALHGRLSDLGDYTFTKVSGALKQQRKWEQNKHNWKQASISCKGNEQEVNMTAAETVCEGEKHRLELVWDLC